MSAGLERVELEVEGGRLPLTVARGRGAGAALVVVPSAFGVGPDLEAQMVELAEDASLVAALDPFFRDRPGPLPFGDMAPVLARLAALDRQRFRRDLRAALAWARAGERPVVLLGICFGGPFALLAAADREVDAIATWHGTRMETFLERAAEMKVPMRHDFGEVDPFVPAAAVQAIRTAFAGRSDVELVVHPGATHGFSHRDAPAYHAAAERAALDGLRGLLRAVRRSSA